MTTSQNLKATAATDPLAALSREDRFHLALQALDAEPAKMWKPFVNVENTEPALFRAQRVDGTVFDSVTKAFNDKGFALDGTNGAVMDTLGLTQEQVHDAFCECRHDTDITGANASRQMARFA